MTALLEYMAVVLLEYLDLIVVCIKGNKYLIM